jgi:hypothetical protein
VAGRALAFSNDEIIRLAKERFVAVVGDDWYTRRQGDAEGEFFRSVADQGPRKGEGGSTRQGIYFLTAGGKLLMYRNAGQNAAAMLDAFKRALAAWDKLPEADRKPAGTAVSESLKRDNRFVRTPPAGGLVVSAYVRILDRDGKSWKDTVERVRVGGVEIVPQAQHDHLWLNETEWRALVLAPEVGRKMKVPDPIAYRIFRFHLVDGTRGEPPMWKRDEVRSGELTLTVEAADTATIKMRLEGSVLISTGADPATSARGYDASLLGTLVYNRSRSAFEKFDIVAIGDHWGEGTYTKGARPGRQPLGVAFELSKGDGPADKVPPQAAREIGAYFRAN